MKGKRLINQIIIITLTVLFIVPVALCDQTVWDCPECGRKGNTGNYCGGCAHPSPWSEVEKGNDVELSAYSKKDFETVDNIVKFGHYEQDNDLNNGPEEIEWIVLDVEDGKSLLLSRYLLDAKPYNNEYTAVTWETCTLREWLNGEFLKRAFSEKEQAKIIITDVDNSESQGDYLGMNGGNNTQDKLFLLSYHEAFELYLQKDESRKCELTDYAIARGGFGHQRYLNGRSIGLWWLRSPVDKQSGHACVETDGSFSYRHSAADFGLEFGCVRPALWINLESGIF